MEETIIKPIIEYIEKESNKTYWILAYNEMDGSGDHIIIDAKNKAQVGLWLKRNIDSFFVYPRAIFLEPLFEAFSAENAYIYDQSRLIIDIVYDINQRVNENYLKHFKEWYSECLIGNKSHKSPELISVCDIIKKHILVCNDEELVEQFCIEQYASTWPYNRKSIRISLGINGPYKIEKA